MSEAKMEGVMGGGFHVRDLAGYALKGMHYSNTRKGLRNLKLTWIVISLSIGILILTLLLFCSFLHPRHPRLSICFAQLNPVVLIVVTSMGPNNLVERQCVSS
jgi:hypothetical protein